VRLFRRYPKDPLALKLMVVASLLVDTACTIAEMATVYTVRAPRVLVLTSCAHASHSTRSHNGVRPFGGSGARRDSRLPPGNPEALTKQIWAGPAYVVTTALSAAIVHGFLIFRFYTLSKQAALTAFYIFCAACALSGGLAAAIVLRLYPLVSQRNKSIITAIVWFSAYTPDRPPAGADGRSPQPPRVRRTCASPSASGGRSRRCSPASGARRGACCPCARTPPLTAAALSMIDRVSKLSIQTGACTTLFALATLSVFLQNHNYNGAPRRFAHAACVAQRTRSGGRDELLPGPRVHAHDALLAPRAPPDRQRRRRVAVRDRL
jgi:hypothetical protein